ncbi:MAG: peptidase [Moraxellaceae bacterium]|nr:MAG: peptidase [Moraxellaceae bacterium]
MIPALLAITFLALSTLPGLWVRWTLARYNKPRKEIQYNGEEFANALIAKFRLHQVTVEAAPEGGDHYDPSDKVVRLSPSNMNTNSLTAIAIAAHEVGHALQDATHYPGFAMSGKVRVAAYHCRKMGTWVFVLAPVVALISKNPIIGFITAGIALLSYLLSSAVQLFNLPIEFDASFKRALPILEDCQYLNDHDLKAARKILKAAAITYVAGALLSMLPLGRMRR